MQHEISVITPCVTSLPLPFSLNHIQGAWYREEVAWQIRTCAVVHTPSTHIITSFECPVVWLVVTNFTERYISMLPDVILKRELASLDIIVTHG